MGCRTGSRVVRPRSRATAERFVAHNSPLKAGFLAALLIGLEAVVIADPSSTFAADEQWLRWVFAVILATGIAFVVRELLEDRPQIVIDGEGIIYRPWSNRRIPWSAIANYRLERELIGDMRRVRLYLRDPGSYPPRSSRIGTEGDRAGRRPDGFVMMTRRLDRHAEDIMEALARFGPAELAAPEERFW